MKTKSSGEWYSAGRCKIRYFFGVQRGVWLEREREREKLRVLKSHWCYVAENLTKGTVTCLKIQMPPKNGVFSLGLNVIPAVYTSLWVMSAVS